MEQQTSSSQREGEVNASSSRPRRRNVKTGVVVSDKMQKTVVVAVQRLVRHPLYKKTMRRSSNFLAHDEKGAHKGDKVRIVETRPLSRRKRWSVEEILDRGADVAAVVTETETTA
ncbi:MAG: 30S ribosomal protein S17 [Vicinamibacteria bacterium]|nr:30S ribosomal protein S17 [Vicinamibacteria bacterium]